MALEPCRECGQEVSTDAETCPSCGVEGPANLPCPKCGSGKTEPASFKAMVIGSLVGASCALWIPVVGWVLIPFLLLLAIGAGIAAFLPGTRYRCKKCGKWWKIEEGSTPAGTHHA